MIGNQENRGTKPVPPTFFIVKQKFLICALLLRIGSAFAKQPNKEVPAPLNYFVIHNPEEGKSTVGLTAKL